MNKNTKLLLSFGIVGIALFFISRARAGQRLQVSFFGLKFGKFTGLQLPVTAQFRIVNGSRTPLQVNSILGTLSVNGQQLSTIDQVQPFTIPANSDNIYPVTVRTSAIDLINIIRQAIRNKKKLSVTFDGNVNSSGLNLPIKQTILTI